MPQGIYTTRPIVVAADDALDSGEMPYCVSFADILPAAVDLDSSVTPTASVSPSGGITLASLGVNVGTFTDNDGVTTCAAGKGVEFVKTSGTAGQTYTATIQATTDGGSVLAVLVPIEVHA